MINSMHHDIQCLSLDSATRPCDRCWFTSKQIQEWSGMTKDTLNRRLERLASVGRIVGLEDKTTDVIDINSESDSSNSHIIQGNSSGANLRLMNLDEKYDILMFKFPDERGTLHCTKIYNLNVLNHLAMVELDNEKLNSIANKFSDILSEVETTGSYNVLRQAPSYMIEDPIERAKAWIREQEEKRALEDKTKELESENEDLKRTKGKISTRREAVALAEASKASRKNKKLMKELDIKRKELDKANLDKDILKTELELACSTMFTNKRVCEMITERFDIKYANSTLKAKTSKALQAIANELGENIVQRKELVNGDQRYVPYYTPRTYDVLAKRLEDDNKYLRQY